MANEIKINEIAFNVPASLLIMAMTDDEMRIQLLKRKTAMTFTIEDIKGNFDLLVENQRELVLYLLSFFMLRDGKHFPDGSMGTIEITANQLRDALATAILKQKFFCEHKAIFDEHKTIFDELKTLRGRVDYLDKLYAAGLK